MLKGVITWRNEIWEEISEVFSNAFDTLPVFLWLTTTLYCLVPHSVLLSFRRLTAWYEHLRSETMSRGPHHCRYPERQAILDGWFFLRSACLIISFESSMTRTADRREFCCCCFGCVCVWLMCDYMCVCLTRCVCVFLSVCVCAVSYTHMTLPTRSTV